MNALRTAAGTLALAIVVGSCVGGGDVAVDPAPASTPDAGAVASVTTASLRSPMVTPPPTTSPGTTSPRTTSPPTTSQRTTSPPTTSAAPEAASTSDSALKLSPLAELVQPAGNLRLDTDAVALAAGPVWVAIEGIGVEGARVRDVGVQANGELEIPGASEVGWYRWSPSPGRAGSAVLAAHIAYDGADGVFRHLDDVAMGALVTIGYDDGTVREFEVVETSHYRKDELPFDRIFAKDGDPVVALITCGGTFNRTLRSYEDNVVVYAVPT